MNHLLFGKWFFLAMGLCFAFVASDSLGPVYFFIGASIAYDIAYRLKE